MIIIIIILFKRINVVYTVIDNNYLLSVCIHW